MEALPEFLKSDLVLVRQHLDSVFRVEGKLMSEVAEYVSASRGKMIRPRMVSLAARALGYDGGPNGENHHTRLGAALELFHVATLLHDDVIDNATLRRGRPTVNARWGADVAILFADYLYASSFDLALAVFRPDVVQVLSRTTQRMTEGEMFAIEKRKGWITVDEYLEIIRSKTGMLYSACAGLGAMVATSDKKAIARFFDFGLNYGMAFQITDDALDYEATGMEWGKEVGADLKEGKQTLPILHALAQASEPDHRWFMLEWQNGREFEPIHNFVKRYNGIDHSLERAGEYSRTALEQLEGLADNEALSCLRRLADGVLVRQS